MKFNLSELDFLTFTLCITRLLRLVDWGSLSFTSSATPRLFHLQSTLKSPTVLFPAFFIVTVSHVSEPARISGPGAATAVVGGELARRRPNRTCYQRGRLSARLVCFLSATRPRSPVKVAAWSGGVPVSVVPQYSIWCFIHTS